MPPPRPRDSRACAARTGPGGRGTARRDRRRRRCRRPVPGAPARRRSSPRPLYPHVRAWRHIAPWTCDAVGDIRGIRLRTGGTAFLGQNELAAGQYSSIRMVIRADLSAIRWNDGSSAQIQWPSPGTGEITLYAIVEQPLAVSSSGAVIVIDFDLGRSFLYNYYGTKEFTLVPWLRAVNSAATGTLRGTVTSSYSGQSQPIPHANGTLLVGDPY